MDKSVILVLHYNDAPTPITQSASTPGREEAKLNGADSPRTEPIQRHGPVKADIRGGEGSHLRCDGGEVVLRSRWCVLDVRWKGREQSTGEDEQERRGRVSLY